MIRVFIADDHEIVRRGLRDLLAIERDMTVVGEAADGRAALNAFAPAAWDVLLLDMTLPYTNGPEILRRMHEADPNVAIVVFSMYAEDQYGPRMLAQGASAYLSKDRPGTEIVAAIRRAASKGGRYLTDKVSMQLMNAPAGKERAPHETLSAREFQVFMLICQGRTASEVAAELDLAASTVGTLVSRMKNKLGAHSVADVVSYAHRVGLID